MRTRNLLIPGAVLALLGCQPAIDPFPSGPAERLAETGRLEAALALHGADAHAMLTDYRVVPAAAACEAEPVASGRVDVRPVPLPNRLSGGATDVTQAHSVVSFDLLPGDYRLCATPLDAIGEPSPDCATASGRFTVHAASTTRGVLHARCGWAPPTIDEPALATPGDPADGVDGIDRGTGVVPLRVSVDIEATRRVTTCEAATIAATANAPAGVLLTWQWTVLGAPDPGRLHLSTSGPVIRFESEVEGVHVLQVTVRDAHGAEAGAMMRLDVAPCLG